MKNQINSSKSKRSYFVTAAVVLLLVFAAYSYWKFFSPVAQITAQVRAALNDPDSAQFKEVRKGVRGEGIWCGYVNARNRMGGMVGFSKFLVDTLREQVLISSDSSSDEVLGKWQTYCE